MLVRQGAICSPLWKNRKWHGFSDRMRATAIRFSQSRRGRAAALRRQLLVPLYGPGLSLTCLWFEGSGGFSIVAPGLNDFKRVGVREMIRSFRPIGQGSHSVLRASTTQRVVLVVAAMLASGWGTALQAGFSGDWGNFSGMGNPDLSTQTSIAAGDAAIIVQDSKQIKHKRGPDGDPV